MKKVFYSIFLCGLITVLVSNGFLGTSKLTASEKSAKSSEVQLNVMTYNLRYLNDSDPSPHTWEERLPAIKKLIQKNHPDIIGTQEAVYQQITDLENTLNHYSWIGLGREGGSKGEYSAIFYNEHRYTPLEYDHFWLSDTPNVIGSTSWGNSIPRMATWAKFLDHASNQSFNVVNTHFDHQSANAREKSAALINEKIKEFDPDLPVLLTGDFNASPDSIPYETLTSEGPFDDLLKTANVTINENLGTFNGFDDKTGGGPDSRIDWVLGKGNIFTHKTRIINDYKNGQFPSDHYPVTSNLTISY
ncbi:endonuclease/exonuclease/phosphatase family protein [Gracilibacillus salinarum]|uniref:Endonuclease/exonuclease/phosphatase family protein n=1 Tax=Gracilibacillus salinarum TaxID=2932255 RepID=A0ABY4GN12_9BACI|nr:endonuclease/exonuclease/phosphatase family protein [Gracilibacillus salinarum]UOQ85765.1 endonuclease/exonuclease/phosphatase family protein [Gracilibacillus salinarum]